MHKPRRVLWLVLLTVIAVAALGLVLRVMLGSGFTLQTAGIRLRVYSLERPVAIAAGSSILLLHLARAMPRLRRLAVALTGTSLILALIAYIRTTPTYVPEGDMAILESYTIWASQLELFLGPYSRFGWNHPGPLYFYLLVPFHALTGGRSLSLWAGALTINLLSLLAIYWIAVRMGATRLAWLLAGATAVYLTRFGEILTSPWNPHVLVLPLGVFMLIASAVTSGAIQWLPLMVLPATFVAQTHVALAPTVVLISGVATVIGIWRAVRSGSHARPSLLRTLNLTAWVVLLLWILPLAQELHAPDGNLSQLWTFFFATEHEGQPFDAAFAAWSEVLTGVFRRGFRVGWGGPYAIRDVAMPQVVAVVEVLLLSAAALYHAPRGRPFHSALAGLLSVASAVACWSVTRVEGDLMDHAIFWISGLGVLNVAVILDAALSAVRRLSRLAAREPAVAACAIAWAYCAMAGIGLLGNRVARASAPSVEEMRTETFSSAIVAYLKEHPGTRPLIRIDQPTWHYVGGAVVQLQKAGLPYAIERAWLSMFGEAAAPLGNENVVIVFARKPRYDEIMSRPGRTLIAERAGTFVVVDTSKELLFD